MTWQPACAEAVSRPWAVQPQALHLRVHVKPRARRSAVEGLRGKALVVRVTAPPAEGAANAAVAAVVAEWLGVPRRSVRVLHGARRREKVLEITGGAGPELAARAEAALRAAVDRARRRD